jgi:hypothetical protein
MRQSSTTLALRQRFPSYRQLTIMVVLFCFTSTTAISLRAQTCSDWKAVIGWQGTYTLSSNGTFVHNGINMFSISETSGATVSMPSQTDGLCNQIRWQGADLNNTGSVNDSTQVLNGCVQGEWFTSDTLMGNSGFPGDSELVVDATDGTFSFQPIPHDYVTHTVYNCQGSQSGQESWATAPGNNWPLNFTLPQQVGPLTVTSFPFSAAGLYAGYQDIDWTITLNLTPILPGYQPLTVAAEGNGAVASTDGVINCPGVCSHFYPPNTQVTLNATAGPGSIFAGWNGACTGTGPCTVTMTQAATVNAVFSEPLQFVGVTPCRVVDTRNQDGQFGGPPLQGRAQRSFSIPQGACNIPSSALAYSLNITVVPQGPLGYLTVWPTGQSQPLVSTMNSPDGRIKANAAIVPAGTDGGVSFYVTNTTNLVVDINGYFETAGNGTLQFFALPPCRVIDTRNPTDPLGGPFLSSGVQRDFPVQNSLCIPTSNVVGALLGNGDGSLQGEVNYPAGALAVAAAVGDFNGDGKPDLITANSYINAVGVLLGNGNGTFQAPVMAGANNFPNALATGDFNHDGKLDLAVANRSSNDVSVLLGNGDGTLRAAVNYPVGGSPRGVAVGDFNGDHQVDLVTANADGNSVSVLINNGDGTFQPAVNYPTAVSPYAVVVADFNGDGKADLATANLVANNVSVLIGNGDGTFQPAVNYAVHVNPRSLVAADFRHDGKMDVATANDGSNDVSVLLGNGNGTFQAAANYAAGAEPISLVAVDLNGDSKLDLAVANTSGNNVGVLIGNGNGTFQAGLPYATGDVPLSVATADFNGDGKPDLVLAQGDGFNHLPQAYSFNVTVVPHQPGQELGYLTLWPQGLGRPVVSTLNNLTGTVVANAAIVPAGSGGGISAYPASDTDLVVDINGYFAAPAGTGLSLYPIPPCRAADTRNNHGQPFTGEKTVNVVGSPCAPPSNAQGYVFNATVAPQGSLGYLTLWPDGQTRPLASTLNAIDGFLTSNMAIVPTSNGSIDAYAAGLTHLVLDISSYFAP